AIINEVDGVVEEINLRTTVLRDDEGAVHVFQNGNIVKLANRTREFSYYVFTLHIAYRDEPDKAIEIVRETTEELRQERPYSVAILAPLEVWGVDHLGDTHVTIKSRIKTLPGRQWEVGREVNRRVRRRMREAGLEQP